MNKTAIRTLLTSSDTAVERAMVALYLRQTADEQHTSATRVLNGRGFSAFNAERGTYYAKWVLSGRRLTGRHLVRARRIATYHARQLAEIAQERRQGRHLSYKVLDAEGMSSFFAHLDPFCGPVAHLPLYAVASNL